MLCKLLDASEEREIFPPLSLWTTGRINNLAPQRKKKKPNFISDLPLKENIKQPWAPAPSFQIPKKHTYILVTKNRERVVLLSASQSLQFTVFLLPHFFVLTKKSPNPALWWCFLLWKSTKYFQWTSLISAYFPIFTDLRYDAMTGEV